MEPSITTMENGGSAMSKEIHLEINIKCPYELDQAIIKQRLTTQLKEFHTTLGKLGIPFEWEIKE